MGWEWRVGGVVVSRLKTFSRDFAAGRHSVELVVSDNFGVRSTTATLTVVGAARTVSTGLGNARRPGVSVDSSGVVHAAWWEDLPASGQIVYAQSRDEGTTFTSQAPVNGSVAAPTLPNDVKVVADGAGNVYVGWDADGRILVSASRDYGQTFGPPVLVPQETLNTQVPMRFTGFGLAAKSGGFVFVAWVANDYTKTIPGCSFCPQSGVVFARSVDFGSSFSSAAPVSSLTESVSVLEDPAAIVDSNGRLFIGYSQRTATTVSLPFQAKLIRSIDDGISFSLMNLPFIGQLTVSPRLAVDDGESLHVQARFSYTSSSDGGLKFSAWIAPVIRYGDQLPLGSEPEHFNLSAAPDGKVFFLVEVTSGSNVEIYSYFSSTGSGFSRPSNVSNSTGQSGERNGWYCGGSGLGALRSGGAIALWHDNTSGVFKVLARFIP